MTAKILPFKRTERSFAFQAKKFMDRLHENELIQWMAAPISSIQEAMLVHGDIRHNERDSLYEYFGVSHDEEERSSVLRVWGKFEGDMRHTFIQLTREPNPIGMLNNRLMDNMAVSLQDKVKEVADHYAKDWYSQQVNPNPLSQYVALYYLLGYFAGQGAMVMYTERLQAQYVKGDTVEIAFVIPAESEWKYHFEFDLGALSMDELPPEHF